MTILYHILYPDGLGADRWIYRGWRNAFEDLGHRVYPVRDRTEMARQAQLVRPDFLITFTSLWNFRNGLPQSLAFVRNAGARVALFVDRAFLSDRAGMALARQGVLAGVFFGERSEESMVDFEHLTGQRYHLIANAADKTMHFPTAPVERYRCDIAYVGARLPKKREQFRKLLLPLIERHHVRIYGPYWTIEDIVLLGGSRLCRRLGLSGLAGRIDRRRLTLPPADENKLYSSAKICVNFHERENGRNDDLINQRTFKIAASGGFQICDEVPSLRHYFTADEVITAGDSQWLAIVEYYLRNDTERERIRKNAAARALRDHTYHARIAFLPEIFSSVRQ